MIIKNYKKIATSQIRKKALDIIDSGLRAINTEKIIKDRVNLVKNRLIIKNIEGKFNSFDLNDYGNIYVIGFGKSSGLMAKVLESKLGNKIDSGLVISTKFVKLKRIRVVKGTHPKPSLKNVKATKDIISLIKNLGKKDLVLTLISGGGSALLCSPKSDLKDYIKKIDKVFASGIDIKKLNQIRKKLSNVKGGKLAKLTKAKVVSIIMSDVVGDDLGTIASGPTYGAKNATNILILNNQVALDAMKDKAKKLGLTPKIYSDKLKGEAKNVGSRLIEVKGSCLLFAGETTVKVKGNGKGGRNMELCLGVVEKISKIKNCCLVSVGSDGRDGPTDAAGAIVDNNSLIEFKKKGLDYKEHLKNNDSYNLLKKTDSLVLTGLTGSNVADIGVMIRL